MQKITEEAFAALSTVKNGKKHPVHAAIEALQPGELLHITPADWQWKTKTPSVFVTREEKSGTKKFEFYKQTDVRGWVVKRIR